MIDASVASARVGSLEAHGFGHGPEPYVALSEAFPVGAAPPGVALVKRSARLLEVVGAFGVVVSRLVQDLLEEALGRQEASHDELALGFGCSGRWPG